MTEMSVLKAHPMRTTEDHRACQCQENVLRPVGSHEHGWTQRLTRAGFQFCNDFLPIEGDTIPQHRRRAAFPSGRGQQRDTFNSDLAASLEPAPDSRLGQPPPRAWPWSSIRCLGCMARRWKPCENADKPRWQSTFYVVTNPYSLIMKFVSS